MLAAKMKYHASAIYCSFILNFQRRSHAPSQIGVVPTCKRPVAEEDISANDKVRKQVNIAIRQGVSNFYHRFWF